LPRILAVDWGERRVGLAVCDPTGTLASGLETLAVRGAADAVAQVAGAAREVEADSIVVGLPLQLSGERGSAAMAAEKFAEALAAATGLPVSTWDERLTSAMAGRRMLERGERGERGRKKGRLDQDAAIALLESWLARLEADRRRAAERP
jgi:putative Holliday junction resolvase